MLKVLWQRIRRENSLNRHCYNVIADQFRVWLGTVLKKRDKLVEMTVYFLPQ